MTVAVCLLTIVTARTCCAVRARVQSWRELPDTCCTAARGESSTRTQPKEILRSSLSFPVRYYCYFPLITLPLHLFLYLSAPPRAYFSLMSCARAHDSARRRLRPSVSRHYCLLARMLPALQPMAALSTAAAQLLSSRLAVFWRLQVPRHGQRRAGRQGYLCVSSLRASVCDTYVCAMTSRDARSFVPHDTSDEALRAGPGWSR